MKLFWPGLFLSQAKIMSYFIAPGHENLDSAYLSEERLLFRSLQSFRNYSNLIFINFLFKYLSLTEQ